MCSLEMMFHSSFCAQSCARFDDCNWFPNDNPKDATVSSMHIQIIAWCSYVVLPLRLFLSEKRERRLFHLQVRVQWLL